MNRRSLLCAAALVSGFSAAKAQLVVGNTLTPQQLVQDVLLGSGVTVSNITFNGGPGNTINEQAGTFDGTNTNIGIPNGVMLATGSVNVALGPNNSPSSTLGGGNFGAADPDLTLLAGVATNDRAVLEFDFVPSGDSISFRFVFASEEYPEYVCGSVNDAFGFFLSGPGISGPFQDNAVNLAVVPGTNVPVSINTVNPGVVGANGIASNCSNLDPNWQANNIYYVDNTGSTTIQFDGQTVVLTARAAVQCNQTYHIKLAIADGGDTAFDSAVFLESSSFSSTPFIPSLTPGPGIVGLNTILESCYPVQIDFTRTGDTTVGSVVYISAGGTATPGLDYDPVFPDSLVFGPGEETIPFVFNVPIDPDGPETVVLTLVSESPCSGVSITNEFIFNIESAPPVVISGNNVNIQCGASTELVPQFGGGYPPLGITWNTGTSGPSLTVSPTALTIYTATVTDDCGQTASADFIVGLIELPPLNMSILGSNTLVEGCESAQINIIRPQGVPGDLTINLSTTGSAQNGSDFQLPGSTVIPDGTLNILLPFQPLGDEDNEGEENVTITATFTDDCGRSVDASVTFTIVDAPEILLVTENFQIECAPDSMEITVIGSGGYGGQLSYVWSNGGTGNSTFVTMQTEGIYFVTATDACGREAFASVQVDVDCEIIIPNVFTPNSDGVNDFWVIEGLANRPNTVRVYNRWGQLVLDSNNYRNTWSALDVPDGTYYYEVIVSKDGIGPMTGHVTILRNRW